MAFTKTVIDVENIGNGHVREYGTWAASGGDTTGTLTAAATGVSTWSAGPVVISSIETSDFTSAATTAVNKEVASPVSLALSFGANDSGTYSLTGKAC